MNMTLPGAFSGKVTLDVGFTDDLVVQCDVPMVKTILWVMVIYRR